MAIVVATKIYKACWSLLTTFPSNTAAGTMFRSAIVDQGAVMRARMTWTRMTLKTGKKPPICTTAVSIMYRCWRRITASAPCWRERKTTNGSETCNFISFIWSMCWARHSGGLQRFKRGVHVYAMLGVCAGPGAQEDYGDSNGGACIYNASLFGWPFLLVWHGQGNKTANCLFFDYYQDTYRAEIGRVS